MGELDALYMFQGVTYCAHRFCRVDEHGQVAVEHLLFCRDVEAPDVDVHFRRYSGGDLFENAMPVDAIDAYHGRETFCYPSPACCDQS